ncbi:hypothetical protein MRX96_032928 [Rhipicephalus microplus]
MQRVDKFAVPYGRDGVTPPAEMQEVCIDAAHVATPFPATAAPSATSGVPVAGGPVGAAFLSDSVLLEHGHPNRSLEAWLACICIGLFIGIALAVLIFFYKASREEDRSAKLAKTRATRQATWQRQPRRSKVTTTSLVHDELSKGPTTMTTTTANALERGDSAAISFTETDEDR